jgi:hypothetical protein
MVLGRMEKLVSIYQTVWHYTLHTPSLKMEAAATSTKLVPIHHTTQHHIRTRL